MKNQKLYRKTFYNKHKEQVKQETYTRRQELISWLIDYKSTRSCINCPENHVACLEFHHRNPEEKIIEIAQAVYNGWSIEKILKEIEKCDLLCSNCHAKLHWGERNSLSSEISVNVSTSAFQADCKS